MNLKSEYCKRPARPRQRQAGFGFTQTGCSCRLWVLLTGIVRFSGSLDIYSFFSVMAIAHFIKSPDDKFSQKFSNP